MTDFPKYKYCGTCKYRPKSEAGENFVERTKCELYGCYVKTTACACRKHEDREDD